MKKISLFIVDPQFDFCNSSGSLYVEGASDDMDRLANVITDCGHIINKIYMSMDMHQLLDIAHTTFWIDKNGNNPEPYSPMVVADVESEKWSPYDISIRDEVINILKALEKKGHTVIVWPPHCIIGTEGSTVVKNLAEALKTWSLQNNKNINHILKGTNPLTEHYSSLEAIVPMEGDLDTYFDKSIMIDLNDDDVIFIAGEAGNVCTKQTVLSLYNHFDDKKDIDKIWWIKDCISPVPGFEQDEQDFLNEMTKKGMHITITEDIYTLSRYH